MYTALTSFIVGFIAVSHGCRPPPCHWSHAEGKQIDDYFDEVARKVIAADKGVQQFCYEHGSSNVKELHGDKEYRLIIPAPGFKEEEHDIQVRDRVLVISPRGSGCGSLMEIRLLPAYVEASQITYDYEINELIFTVPYKFNIRTGGYGGCDETDKQTRFVRKSCKTEIY